MDQLLDPSKYQRIYSIALDKSPWLNTSDTDIDDEGTVSFFVLSNIIYNDDDDDIIGRIIEAYSKIRDANQGRSVHVSVKGQRYLVSFTDMIWGRMCVIAYYFYHADPLWKDMGCHDKMLSMIKNTSILKAVNDSIVLIDSYYSDVEAIKQKKAQNTSLTPQPIPNNNNMPDVVQTMQDINAGKIAYTEVDWKLQIKTVLKLINLMPTKFPNVIWLWGLLGEIDDINTRIDILHKMQEVAYNCFDEVLHARDFKEDCDCLIYVYQGSLQYNTKNIGLRHYWTDDRQHLNDLAHILCKEMVDPKFMVAIAEEMYQASQGDRKQYMLSLVLRASRNIGQISMDNIIDFAKNLYIAEGFRHLILSGEEDYRDIPALADFEPKLLKACFEEYIRLRTIDIKDIIEQDLTHCGDAEELECLEYLFEEESQHVNRENILEDFRGSAAYNAMWYPGKQKVLDMINVFIEYLKNKIKKLKKEEAKLGIRDHIQNFNVQGDYIAGDKHVGAHIDNVSPGAIGAQTTKD